MYITEARSVLLSSAGPGKDPENRPVSFWVFLSSEKTILPEPGRDEGRQCDRCRLLAGHCIDATDPLEQGY